MSVVLVVALVVSLDTVANVTDVAVVVGRGVVDVFAVDG